MINCRCGQDKILDKIVFVVDEIFTLKKKNQFLVWQVVTGKKFFIFGCNKILNQLLYLSDSVPIDNYCQ